MWMPLEPVPVTREGYDAQYENNRVTVYVKHYEDRRGLGPMTRLLVASAGMQHFGHDWRILQRVKNEIVGPECEAVEIYPPESEVRDVGTGYHIWCFDTPEQQTGIAMRGGNQRNVSHGGNNFDREQPRHIYIDCGAHIGNTVKAYIDNHPEAVVTAFEASPECATHPQWRELKSRGVNLIKSAVHAYDGETKFYVNYDRPHNQWGSLCKKKNTGNLDTDHPVNVPCVDLSGWILRHVQTHDRLVLKVDVEGAEYTILPKMIFDNTLRMVDELLIEWHWQKLDIPGMRNVHDALRDQVINTVPEVVEATH